jgi:8-oxo-dGTP pyrophosphatase MutT (NUDIX family)
MIGLIDEGEKPETTAERELLEETGYHGKASHTSFLMFNGTAHDNMYLDRPRIHEYKYECRILRCGYG